MDRLFDTYIAVDWSARTVPSPKKPTRDAIWVGIKDLKEKIQTESYFRTRYSCINYLRELLIKNVKEKNRTLIGYDLDFGFPSGYVDALDISGNLPKWLKMWNLLVDLIRDNDENSNNRFEVAAYLNSKCIIESSSQVGPLWGCPRGNTSYETLNPKSPKFPFITKNGQILRKKRWTEQRESRAQPVWKLIGSASVGGQTLVGIPAVFKLRFDSNLKLHSKVWPFETKFLSHFTSPTLPLILHVEIWPGILASKLDKNIKIKDRAQVRATVDWIADCDKTGELQNLLSTPSGLTSEEVQNCIEEEGWVLGSGLSKEIESLNEDNQLTLF